MAGAEDANARVEVAVVDRRDGRFVPGLDVEVRLSSTSREGVGRRRLPFLWHPYLYHYGANWTVPAAGDYRLDVRIAPPRFGRHDPVNGCRYAGMVEVAFERVHVDRGVKHSPTAVDRVVPPLMAAVQWRSATASA